MPFIPTIEITKKEQRRFERAMGEIVRRSGISVETVVLKVALDLHRDFVRLTPVDTGRARAAWTVWLDSRGRTPPIGGRDPQAVAEGKQLGTFRENLPGRSAQSRDLRKRNLKADRPFVEVTNNVFYIIPLEFGWSRQAPAGFARVTVRRHARLMVQNLKRAA